MATDDNTTKDSPAKRAALSLLAKGLASQAEVARLAGVSRQLMKHWAREIPVERNREALVLKLWKAEMRRRR